MMGCFAAAREEFSSDQKLLSHWELQLRKLPPVLLAADPWRARGTQRSMLNPSTALVYLIGHQNERERNPSIGTVQRIKEFSLIMEVSNLEMRAIESIILVQ